LPAEPAGPRPDPGVAACADSRGLLGSGYPVTIATMPIYEFVCDRCGERFEELVPAGTDTVECDSCRAPGAHRVLSPPAELARLVKSPGDRRKQERRNADLHARTKASFKERRRKAREAKKGPASG
jgi:putative FmdB family regulatory protein